MNMISWKGDIEEEAVWVTWYSCSSWESGFKLIEFQLRKGYRTIAGFKPKIKPKKTEDYIIDVCPNCRYYAHNGECLGNCNKGK